MSARNPVKQRILSFATEKFLREGFSKVTVEEIAGDLLISKKTFYKFFDGKEDLVLQVVAGIMSGMKTRFARIVESEEDFVEKLSVVMALLAHEVSRFGRPFQVDLQRHAPEIWMRVENFRRQRITQYFSRLLAQGVTEGYVRKEINQRIFLLSYLGAVERIVRPSVLIEESFSIREALHGILSVFFEGILTKEARQRLQELQQIQRQHIL